MRLASRGGEDQGRGGQSVGAGVGVRARSRPRGRAPIAIVGGILLVVAAVDEGRQAERSSAVLRRRGVKPGSHRRWATSRPKPSLRRAKALQLLGDVRRRAFAPRVRHATDTPP